MEKVSWERFLGFRVWNYTFIGKFFHNNGNIYEGEWKDGNQHGQGKKSYLLNALLILTLLNSFKKASTSTIMGTYMKESGKMAISMVKVRKVIYWMLYWYLHCSILSNRHILLQ